MSYKRNMKDLNDKLNQQLNFIRSSLKSFNQGNEEEAIRLATSIRVLIHDTMNSTSLLKQLNHKSDIMYCSSVSNYIPTNQVSYLGLCGIRLNNEKGDYYPSFDAAGALNYKFISFDNWWNELIFDDKTNQFSRKDIVLFVANKDGGAHIDSEIPESFYALSSLNSLGFNVEIVDHEGKKSCAMNNNPMYCSIACIAQELLISIDLFDSFKIMKTQYIQEKTVEVRSISNIRYMVIIEKMETEMLEMHKILFTDLNVNDVKLVIPQVETLKHVSKLLVLKRLIIRS